MSSGQTPRTPDFFPRMKDRAAGRRARKSQREAWRTILYDPDFFPRLGRALEAWAEALATITTRIGRAFAEAAQAFEFPRPLIARGPTRQAEIDAAQQPEVPANPTQAVIDAIDGLEHDEIGERVRWQLEEGVKRGDHLPELWPNTVSVAPAGTLPPGLGGNPAAWHPIGEISRERW